MRRRCPSFGSGLGLAASRGGFLDLGAAFGEIGWRPRLRVLLDMELRGRAAIVDPRHLPGEAAEIARRLGRDKQRDVLAMPGQRDIAGGVAPVLAVVEVGLVERAPLPFVDRAGIAVPEFVELARGIIVAGDKGDQALGRSGLAVKCDRDLVALDHADGADTAIDDPGLPFLAARRGAGELDPVAFGKGGKPVRRLEPVIVAERPLLPALLALAGVELYDVGIGVGEDKADLVRIGRDVPAPLLHERLAGLLLPAAPMDRALPGKDRERRQEFALVH